MQKGKRSLSLQTRDVAAAWKPVKPSTQPFLSHVYRLGSNPSCPHSQEWMRNSVLAQYIKRCVRDFDASLKGKVDLFIMEVSMQTVEDIRKALKAHRQQLKERFKVEEIGIFGSYVRKQQRSNSDVDVLVTFSETVDLFTFVELENHLREILGVKVDLVMKDALKPRLKERILCEAEYL